jgi:hypothetical protein
MSASPYQPDDIAMCRHVVTHAQNLQALAAGDRAEILGAAYDILVKDRAARVARALAGDDAAARNAPARVLSVPLAVFQAGRPRRRPRLLVVPRHPGTPGDAA